MILGRWAVILSVATLGCVQRAALTAPVVLPSPTETLNEASTETVVAAPSSNATQYVIRKGGSSVLVFAVDIVTGNHTLTFHDFRGSLTLDEGAATGRLMLAVDMMTVTSTNQQVTRIIRDELLESDLFPFARLVAVLRPGNDPDERKVEGNMLLHGVELGISFVGTLRREGEGYRFTTDFDMSRHAFGIRRSPRMDWMINDDFRVEFNLLAKPEKVTVEVLDSPPP
jgi:polyisoprenoid-binding protein YceI